MKLTSKQRDAIEEVIIETMVDSMTREELREFAIRTLMRAKGIPQGPEIRSLMGMSDQELVKRLDKLGIIATEEELVDPKCYSHSS